MAKFDFQGVDRYIAKLEKLHQDANKTAGHAIYAGAGTVMKYVLAGIDTIVTDDHFGTPDNPTNGPKTFQKEALYRSIGIAPARYDGNFYNVKIGFDGYNQLKTKRWPNGQPNSMVARSIQSGTSWMKKQPFMRKAEQAARGPCEAVMERVVEEEIDKIMK